jgi:hypothetical protein
MLLLLLPIFLLLLLLSCNSRSCSSLFSQFRLFLVLSPRLPHLGLADSLTFSLAQVLSWVGILVSDLQVQGALSDMQVQGHGSYGQE